MLARVFVDPTAPWILKGGTSLLIRIPGARHSRDIDLLHPDADLEQAYADLAAIVSAPSPLDRLTFQLRVDARNENEGSTLVWKLRATPVLGSTLLQHFPIDLTAGKELVGEIDRIVPTPTIEIDDVATPLPAFSCYPIVDQLADKLAAMYEYHGVTRTPSSRWRDLVDLLLLLATSSFDAAKLHLAIDHQRAHRPALDLPVAVRAPGPRWHDHDTYPATARAVPGLPAELRDIDVALDHLGRCMNPLLGSSVTDGTWNPTTWCWEPV
jgi:hypothetical protein